jgi:hypothetical protein
MQLFSAAPLVAGLGGLIERIGDAANSTLSAKLQLPDGSVQKWNDKTPITNHTSALEKLIRFLGDNVSSSIEQEVRGARQAGGVRAHQRTTAPRQRLARHARQRCGGFGRHATRWVEPKGRVPYQQRSARAAGQQWRPLRAPPSPRMRPTCRSLPLATESCMAWTSPKQCCWTTPS